jgi:hypothetical protein
MRPLAVLAVASLPLLTLAQTAPAGGFVQSDDGRTEVLSAPSRVGERVDRPEGWYRIEEGGADGAAAGSFTIVPATPTSDSGAPLREEDDARASTPPVREPTLEAVVAATDPCRTERTRYLAELLRTQGVELADPVGFLEGLQGDRFAQGLSWFWLSLSIDPVRPLAWSSDLRDRAKALARCASEG